MKVLQFYLVNERLDYLLFVIASDETNFKPIEEEFLGALSIEAKNKTT